MREGGARRTRVLRLLILGDGNDEELELEHK